MKFNYQEVKDNILEIKKDKRNDVYNWGNDNAFPSLIETLIKMSVTSKNCVDKVSKAIYGKSFGELGELIVNKEGQSLNEVLRIAAREYAKHNNAFIYVSYQASESLDLKIKSIKVFTCKDIRKGKADDLGYIGKFVKYDNWDKSKVKRIEKSKFKLIHRYNKLESVLLDQINDVGGIAKHSGQLIHIQKDTNEIYSESDLVTVLSEALTEYNSSLFRSNGSENGFLNTKVITTQPFQKEDDRRAFKKTLDSVRGAKNAGRVLHLEASQQMDDLSKQMKLDSLSDDYNDKLFKYSDQQSESNICKAFGVPKVLVNPSDSGLFGNSGELLREAKKQLWEDKEEERNQLEEVFNELMNKFINPIEGKLEIINPYEDETSEETEETPANINDEAQANLRGSVGGVTALLQIQQSVAEGITGLSAGIAIVQNIYGFTQEEASKMLGKPELKTEENDTTINNTTGV